jgi:cell division initiation protein
VKITSLEVLQHKFKKALKGYQTGEVDAFMERVAETIEELTKKNLSLAEELERVKETLSGYEKREWLVKETMTTAQKVVDDMKKGAEREVDLLIGDAKLKADKIIREAYKELLKFQDDIQQLKVQRIKLETDLKSVLEYHQKLLCTEEEKRSVEEEKKDKVKYIKYSE